jgi:hypothetical protein
MIKLRLLLLIVFANSLILSPMEHAKALSCAQPTVSHLYKYSDKIFIGELLNEVESTEVITESGNYILFKYKVVEALKGVSSGDVVEIRYSTTWGDDAPRKHMEGTLVSASVDDGVLVSIDCKSWLPANDDTAGLYGYKSLGYMKRDIRAQGQIEVGSNTSDNSPETYKKSPFALLVFVSISSFIFGGLVVYLVVLSRKISKRHQKQSL